MIIDNHTVITNTEPKSNNFEFKRNKQIEEMARVIYENTAISCVEIAYEIAEALYIAGYRKDSDVARKIFEEIEKCMKSLDHRHMMCGNPKQSWGVRSAMAEISELKKKYTESEKDDG